MEIKILSSVIYKELVPWSIQDVLTNKSVNEKIKNLNQKQPCNSKEFILVISNLISDFPDLITWLKGQSKFEFEEIVEPNFKVEHPQYYDSYSKFYHFLISYETSRIYNAFYVFIEKYHESIDIAYHANLLLNNLKFLTVDVVKETKALGFEDLTAIDNDLNHFVLILLKQKLTVLFFSIQDLCKDHLPKITTSEDFYLIDLSLPIASSKELVQTFTSKKLNSKSVSQSFGEKFNFGFKGDPGKLEELIKHLCLHYNLLNEETTEPKDFTNVLISKNVFETLVKIQFGCNTNLLTYIIVSLQIHLPKLTFANIENSGLFLTKNGIPIKASLLSNSKSNNSLPNQKKEEINSIFKEILK